MPKRMSSAFKGLCLAGIALMPVAAIAQAPAPAPAAPVAPAGAPAASDPAPSQPFKGMRVLVAEDNLVNQKVATRMLEKLGCRVTLAANGAQAVRLFAASSFDIVLMDCYMPEMDGFETTRQLRGREQEAGSHIPIIAMTANAMQGDREMCLAAGMDDYLTKPIRVERLVEALGQVPQRKDP